jgi:hypothetical protein
MGPRRTARITVAASAAIALAALGGGGAAGAGTGAGQALPDRLRPTTVPTSFQALAVSGANRERVSFRMPEWWASRRLTQAAFTGDVVERLGTRYWAAAGSFAGRVERNTYAARPDGYSNSLVLTPGSEFLLAKARAGRPSLKPVRLDNRAALRGDSHVRANECAGLGPGTLSVWLDRRTLLPLQVQDVRGGRRFGTRYTLSRVRARLPNSVFAPPRVERGAQRVDQGFRRTSPAAASGPLSYVPLMPTALPRGYELAVSGWARRGSRLGPEGSIAPHRDLFAAVFRRGFERIEITQRLASGSGGWPVSPFGAECVFHFTERARVGGAAATYGAGPQTVPHLYWRSGRLLHTISGAYPKATLVAIAESLRPLGS